MAFTMTEVGRALSDGDIQMLEKKLAVNLTEDYKMFLKRNNGGRPDPTYFPIYGFDNNPKGTIQVFFRINGLIESSNLDWNYRTFLGRIPENFFPIAREDGGSLICLSLSGENKGMVYYWDYYGETQPPTYDNVYQIAGTFQSFLDSLHFYDPLADEDVPPLIKRDFPH